MPLELPPGRTLYIARHGQTVANLEGRFQGDAIDTPLTALGNEQARGIGTVMQREAGDLSQLQRVSSPLPRARMTMEIVLGVCGAPVHSYVTDKRIVEIDLGDWDGLTKDQVRARFPGAYEAREADKWNVRAQSSRENYSDVAARAESWIADLKGDTFAVSHGAFTRILRGLFLGLDADGMSNLDEPQGCVFQVRGSKVERLDP